MNKLFISIISLVILFLFNCKESKEEKKNEQILYVKVNELLVRDRVIGNQKN